MKKVFHNIALEVGGSHYPTVGGELLEKFGEAVVQKCISAIAASDLKSETFTTYDFEMNPRIVQTCINCIVKEFSE